MYTCTVAITPSISVVLMWMDFLGKLQRQRKKRRIQTIVASFRNMYAYSCVCVCVCVCVLCAYVCVCMFGVWCVCALSLSVSVLQPVLSSAVPQLSSLLPAVDVHCYWTCRVHHDECWYHSSGTARGRGWGWGIIIKYVI